MKKWLTLLLVLTLVMSALVPLTAMAEEELPFVTLKVLFPGDGVEDSALIYEEKLRELTERDGLNCNIDIDYVSWADVATQYVLQLASGTPYDLIHVNSEQYFNEARKGAFREITMEEIQTYMPLTYAKMSPDVWNLISVDGAIYFIPWYAGTVDGYFEFAVRTDKAAEYGIEVKDVDSLEAFLTAAVAENPAAVTGSLGDVLLFDQYFGYGSTPLSYFKVAPDGNGGLDYNTVVLKYATDDYLEYAKRMRRWQENGLISKNAASASQLAGFNAGGSYICEGNLGELSKQIMLLKNNDPTAEAHIIDVTPNATKYASSNIAQGYAISGNSKNPERALMLLDKLKNDREYHDLTFVGAEGIHYTNVEGDESMLYYVPTEDSGRFPKFGTAMWGWYNKEWARYGTEDLPEYVEMDYTFEMTATTSKLAGFAFDNTEVQAEVAACQAIISKYETIINYGMEADVEGMMTEFLAALDKAGMADIQAEFMRQYNEYMSVFE